MKPTSDLQRAGAGPAEATLGWLGSSPAGLSTEEAQRRLRAIGPNAVTEHGTQALAILGRQLRNPLLILLGAATATAFAVGEHSDAVIILAIVSISVGLGFINEYRSERAVAELHGRIRHTAVVLRDGSPKSVDVVEIVPGDVVSLNVGDIVPADIRLLKVTGLECDEAVLTGESMTRSKTTAAVPATDAALKLPSCAFMGTVVQGGSGRGVVVATGSRTVFGQVAQALGRRPPETAFQRGLRDFSLLLVWVTFGLTASIFVANALLGRPLLEAALFSLAVAVGLTPQLLPAIVTISLSVGARRLARRSVVVKRLVSIEDLGNIQVLFTDKTGTLTEGRIKFHSALDAAGKASSEVFRLGLLCNDATNEKGSIVGGNPLDRALWEAATVTPSGYRRISDAPFDYDRRLMSVLVESPDGQLRIISKGAPESILARCRDVPARFEPQLERLFDAGARVVAVASRAAPGLTEINPADERELQLDGLLTFEDPVKHDARESLERLKTLGITVKIVTGDNPRVTAAVCRELGIAVTNTLTGSQLDWMDDHALLAALPDTSIFARVTPEQKSRIIGLQRTQHVDVAFLGDGVNDAVALHDADVGISVDSATDVAKDAADIVLLEKDLGILADGVIEGRRIFSNTIKYVLMGTSSNFGNMFSAAGASLFLPFLPMTPTQILLNNLLYDVSEMTIPTDRVDAEMLARPAQWDTRFIRRFMLAFGPISSLFDFLTFGVMLWVFNATHSLFQTGWFVESLATQTLVIFIIRTRRVPFFHSPTGRVLVFASVASVVIGAILPFTPAAAIFGFRPLPPGFFVALALMVVVYLALVELAKAIFFRRRADGPPLAASSNRRQRRIFRLRTRWSTD